MPDKPKRPFDPAPPPPGGCPAEDGFLPKIVVSRLPAGGMPVRFEAGPAARAALAERLGIVSVERFTADVVVAPWRGDGVKVTGRLSAGVLQTSVVTLEPLAEAVEEEVDLLFAPDHSRLARLPELKDGELHLDPEGEDAPDTFSGDRIDLGEALTEILALGLDPYPREADAVFEAIDTDPDPLAGAVSPFDALRKLT